MNTIKINTYFNKKKTNRLYQNIKYDDKEDN